MKYNFIHNTDCIEGMRLLHPNSVDLVITDPPYLIDYRSERRTKLEKFDKIKNDKDETHLIHNAVEEYHRVLKDDTAIYMFCNWHHVDFFKQEFERKFKLKNIIVWNKNNHGSGDLKGAYAPKHEFVLFGHKGRSLLRTKRIPDVIDCPKIDSSKLDHPTQKPIELLSKFVCASSDIGGLILDGFAGTGSTGMASIINDRFFLGYELEKKFCDIGNGKLETILN